MPRQIRPRLYRTGSIYTLPTGFATGSSRLARLLAVALVLAVSGPAQAADTALPKPVQRAFDQAIAHGDAESLGLLVGGNPGLGAEIVARAVGRRPDLAPRTAAANAPQVAPQLAAAAAVVDPAAAADIAAAVSASVPAARNAVADAVVGTLPPDDRMAAGGKVRAAVKAFQPPSLDDPD